jgi:hypothetical protein
MYFQVLEFVPGQACSPVCADAVSRSRSCSAGADCVRLPGGQLFTASATDDCAGHRVLSGPFTLVLLALFWVQELFTREIDRKIILHSLALPASRASFFVGRYLSVLVLARISDRDSRLCLLLAVVLASPGYEQEFPVDLGESLSGWPLSESFSMWQWLPPSHQPWRVVSTVPVMPLATGAAFAIGGKALGASWTIWPAVPMATYRPDWTAWVIG